MVSRDQWLPLAERVRMGDEDALMELMRVLTKIVARAADLPLQREASQEILQDTWLAYWQHRQEIEPLGTLAWLIKTANRLKIDAWRKAKSRGRDRVDCLDTLENANHHHSFLYHTRRFEDDVITQLDWRPVWARLRRMGNGYYTTVVLLVRGYSYPDIAIAQGIPEGTVKSRINYARKMLRRVAV